MDATAKSIFKQEKFKYEELDDLFSKIASEVNDCYIAVHHGNSTRFFVVIAGEPYSAAVVDAAGRRLTRIQEFFDFCNKLEVFNLEAFSADKKLLLCMLVGFAYQPDQTFTTDVVNVKDALSKIQGAGSDLIMILRPGPNTKRGIGFSIFVKGEPALVFLPHESTETGPLHKLLDYCNSLGEGETLAIDLYNNTKVTPANDAGPFPTTGITKQYATRDLGTPSIELSEEGMTIGTYDVNGDVTIGRDPTNVIRLPEAGVSREHAVIKMVDGEVVVEDLNSANGTAFKNIKIEHKTLSDGDEIVIRAYTLKLTIPGIPGKEEVKKPKERSDLATQALQSIKDKEGPDGPKPATLTMEDGAVHTLGNITSLGRDDDCDIVLDGITFAKRHAAIVKGRNIYKIMKKGGMAAVKVNGEKIEEATLRDGDKIDIGSYSMTFTL